MIRMIHYDILLNLSFCIHNANHSEISNGEGINKSHLNNLVAKWSILPPFEISEWEDIV